MLKLILAPGRAEQNAVERVSAAGRHAQQQHPAHHRHILPEIRALRAVLGRIGIFPKTMRRERGDNRKQQDEDCRIRRRNTKQKRKAAEEFDGRPQVGEEFRDATLGEAGNGGLEVQQLRPAAEDENEPDHDAGN